MRSSPATRFGPRSRESAIGNSSAPPPTQGTVSERRDLLTSMRSARVHGGDGAGSTGGAGVGIGGPTGGFAQAIHATQQTATTARRNIRVEIYPMSVRWRQGRAVSPKREAAQSS